MEKRKYNENGNGNANGNINGNQKNVSIINTSNNGNGNGNVLIDRLQSNDLMVPSAYSNNVMNLNNYAGMNNVIYSEGDHDGNVSFPSDQSFTIDLKIAKEFRGDKELILACNPVFKCVCDVSWISLFDDEKEILMCM